MILSPDAIFSELDTKIEDDSTRRARDEELHKRALEIADLRLGYIPLTSTVEVAFTAFPVNRRASEIDDRQIDVSCKGRKDSHLARIRYPFQIDWQSTQGGEWEYGNTLMVHLLFNLELAAKGGEKSLVASAGTAG